MKIGILLLMFLVVCLSLISDVDGQASQLDVPSNWRTEKVALPPPFAPKVKLKGTAQVYFSPGWSKKDSDEFFTYAFLFQTEAEPKFDKHVIKNELLAYFGGLASAVSRGKVDSATFKLNVEEVKKEADSGTKGEAEAKSELPDSQNFRAELKWTEPFFTKSEQTLHLEITSRFDAVKKKNYLMVCVSPQNPKTDAKPNAKVWQQLRKIQGKFLNGKIPAETTDKQSVPEVAAPR